MFEYYDLLQRRLEETPQHAGNWYLPDPAKVYSEADIRQLGDRIEHAVGQARKTGGDVLERCLEAQKVWSMALASLSDPDRDKNGPKQFNEPSW